MLWKLQNVPRNRGHSNGGCGVESAIIGSPNDRPNLAGDDKTLNLDQTPINFLI